jgi:DNA-binding LytR/AlgR family response regulator
VISTGSITPICVLAVDDERPALGELEWLLGRDERVGTVLVADSAADALRLLQEHRVDLVVSDIRMPGLTGLELAQVLRQFREPPRVVFVTAYDAHAVDAFEVGAVDYLLKPVRESRLAEAIGRAIEAPRPASEDDEPIPVESGGVTRFVRRGDVRWVEAHGDYTRLHTEQGSPLVRIPLTRLETDWADAGFVRIHRSTLVSLAHVAEVRVEAGKVIVVVGDEELAVSRRHARELRDLLVRRGGRP